MTGKWIVLPLTVITAVSFSAFSEPGSSTAANIVKPSAAPSPVRSKQTTKRTTPANVRSRTETVNNDERITSAKRRTPTGIVHSGQAGTADSYNAQDGSGTDNANRRPKNRVSTQSSAGSAQRRRAKKNQDIEVENDETHLTSPAAAGSMTPPPITTSVSGKKPGGFIGTPGDGQGIKRKQSRKRVVH